MVEQGSGQDYEKIESISDQRGVTDPANKETVRRRNPLQGLQTGGRCSPWPLPINEFGYTPYCKLSPEERKRVRSVSEFLIRNK